MIPDLSKRANGSAPAPPQLAVPTSVPVVPIPLGFCFGSVEGTEMSTLRVDTPMGPLVCYLDPATLEALAGVFAARVAAIKLGVPDA